MFETEGDKTKIRKYNRGKATTETKVRCRAGNGMYAMLADSQAVILLLRTEACRGCLMISARLDLVMPGLKTSKTPATAMSSKPSPALQDSPYQARSLVETSPVVFITVSHTPNI